MIKLVIFIAVWTLGSNNGEAAIPTTNLRSKKSTTEYALNPADDDLKRKYPQKQLKVPVVGVPRTRLTDAELAEQNKRVLFQGADLWTVLSDPQNKDVGVSGNECVGTESEAELGELDKEGNPIAFTHARKFESAKCTMKIHFGDRLEPQENLFFVAYIKPRNLKHTLTQSMLFYFKAKNVESKYNIDYQFFLPTQDVWHRIQMPVKPEVGIRNYVELKFSYCDDFEIGGVEITDYFDKITFTTFPETPLYYDGMEEGSEWRSNAASLISEGRLRNFTITVLDKDRKPITESVVLEQVQHEFDIGAAVQNYLWKDKFANKTLEFHDSMLDFHASIFNEASFFYELKRPRMREAALDEIRDYNGAYWAAAGIKARGHYLIAPKRIYTPRSIWNQVLYLDDTQGAEAAGEYLQETCLANIQDTIGKTIDYVKEWDTIYRLPDGAEYFGINIIADGDGYLDASAQIEWLQEVKRISAEIKNTITDSILMLWPDNLYDEHQKLGKIIKMYNDLLQRASSSEVKPDLMGYVLHLKGMLGMPFLIDRINTLESKLSPQTKFKVTQLSLPCFNDDVHAQYIHDILTVVFADFESVGVHFDRFFEKGDPTGFQSLKSHFKDVETPYKSGAAIQNFFYHQHWTHQKLVLPDTNGEFWFKAYYGTYKIRYGEKEYFFDLKHNTDTYVNIQLLDV